MIWRTVYPYSHRHTRNKLHLSIMLIIKFNRATPWMHPYNSYEPWIERRTLASHSSALTIIVLYNTLVWLTIKMKQFNSVYFVVRQLDVWSYYLIQLFHMISAFSHKDAYITKRVQFIMFNVAYILRLKRVNLTLNLEKE